MTAQLLPDLLRAAPELILAIGGMALLMVAAFFGDGSSRRVAFIAVTLLAIATSLVAGVVHAGGAVVSFNGAFVTDSYGQVMKILILAGSAFSIIMSIGFFEREGMAKPEIFVLMLFATLGMMLMVSANDLLSLYMGIELQSLPLYVLAAIRRDTVKSSEAGLKYFVLGALSSGLLLYGISLIYGATGTTGFEALHAQFSQGATPEIGLIIGLVFLSAGLVFKMSGVPFHMWTPDVYEGAPTAITAFFAAAPKIAAIALALRVLIGPFGDLIEQWRQLVIAVAIGSMAIGAFAAIAQTNIKRLMAYSSIGHVGYAMMGLAAGQGGVAGVMIYLAIYMFMSIGSFGIIMSMRRDGKPVENISDLAGLSKSRPLMAAAMTIFMFSMAGIPPLAGFFGKFMVFISVVNAGLVWLAILGVVLSVVSAFYYLRIIKVMYFDEATAPLDRDIAEEVAAVVFFTAAFTALFCLMPEPLIQGIEQAAKSLTQVGG